jgi:hypothetical protein
MSEFELVVNATTVKQLALEIPRSWDERAELI